MTILTRASRRLATLLRRRNEQTHRRASAAANAADKVLRDIWRQLLDLLAERRPWPETEWAARYLLRHLQPSLAAEITNRLDDAAHYSWRGAIRDLGAAITSFDDMLFPPPSAAEVNAIVFGNQWQQRLVACTRLADPATLANIVAGGIAAGKSNQEIAKQILPVVNNVRASARRIARTESVRVAGAMQMKAHEALGDLVIAYQVHSMHDHHTRPWHLARDRTIYYKYPQSGQKGLRQMPRPPDEPDDPAERPAGTPKTAWNCRCWLSPILRP